MYFMQAKHISITDMARCSGYTRRGFLTSKQHQAGPSWQKLVAMSDEIDISLDELCDLRIPVDSVEITDPRPVYPGVTCFSEEKKEYFKNKSLKDTKIIIEGMGAKFDIQEDMQ